MKLLKYILPLFIVAVAVFSCNDDDDDAAVVPPKPYDEQYATDNEAIEEYLKTHYVTITNAPGETSDMDVVITKIEGGTETPIWDMPNLQTRTVTIASHGVTYNIYYLNLRQGIATNPKPSNFDAVFTAYRGTLLNGTQFDYTEVPSTMLRLENLIRGWGEIFPQFNTGSYTTAGNGATVFNDFGAGVMFLPSGLGYYNVAQIGIPSYSPLVFSFKLYEVQRLDQDGDGIPTYLEDIDGDGYITELDDTDHDNIVDFRDIDDDGDQILTQNELKIPDTDPQEYYDYFTVPDCSGNTTDPNRIRKYLDSSCH